MSTQRAESLRNRESSVKKWSSSQGKALAPEDAARHGLAQRPLGVGHA